MSTVRITDLVETKHLPANTANTIFVGVDLESGVTSKYTATTLSEGLYSYVPLKVGNNEILLDHTIGQFSGSDPEYLQVNIQNFDGTASGDYVVTANNGTNSNSYIDFGLNGSEYTASEYSSMGAYDGYLYVSGPSAEGPIGNLILSTASTGANIIFAVGGTETSNILAVFSKSAITLKSGKKLIFGDGTEQNTASASEQYSIASFDTANTAYSNTVYLQSVNNAQNTSISALQSSYLGLAGTVATANTFLQANDALTLTNAKSYTDTANNYIQSNYLANTTGTFNGSLTFTGNINTKGLINLSNPNVTDNSIFLLITGAANSAYQPPSNPGYTIHTTSIDGQGNRIVSDAFGTGANNYASFIGRRGRGTAELPSAVQSGDVIARFGGNGFGTTKFSQYGDGRIEVVAAENFTDISKRTKIDFYTTESGSNNANIIATFNGSSAVFSGIVNPQKGFAYTPNVISSSISTLDIDIANNSLYKVSTDTGLTISLGQFQTGKVVEVWISNINPNQNRTITHGCFANNSTVGTASFTLTSQKVAYLRYFSIDGDLANTFVSINYS